MQRFLSMVFCSLGWWAGWWLGNRFNIWAALVGASIGAGLALYGGRWIMNRS